METSSTHRLALKYLDRHAHVERWMAECLCRCVAEHGDKVEDDIDIGSLEQRAEHIKSLPESSTRTGAPTRASGIGLS